MSQVAHSRQRAPELSAGPRFDRLGRSGGSPSSASASGVYRMASAGVVPARPRGDQRGIETGRSSTRWPPIPVGPLPQHAGRIGASLPTEDRCRLTASFAEFFARWCEFNRISVRDLASLMDVTVSVAGAKLRAGNVTLLDIAGFPERLHYDVIAAYRAWRSEPSTRAIIQARSHRV